MKHFVSLVLALGIASVSGFAEVNFSGLDLSDSNQLLFSAAVDVPDFGSYRTLVSANMDGRTMRQLTFFPEQIMLLASSGQLQIQNRFGVFRSNSNLTDFKALADFPAFVDGSSIQTGKISPMVSSPDGRFLVYLDATSAAYAHLILYDSKTGRKTTIADRVELSLQGPPVAWAPQSDYFIYAKDGRLYYYSIAQLLGKRVLSEDLRSVGKGTIANVRWGSQNDLFYLSGSLVYRIQSAEFFTRSLYQSLLGIGSIAGKIPFTFDPNFDRFWISPRGDKIMLDKGGRNVFLYFLQPDDFLSTGATVSLPYLFLPRNTRIDQVLWTPDDRIAVLTHSIVSGAIDSAVYRLDMSVPAANYAFVQTPEKKVHGISIDSADHRYIALLTDTGVVLKDYGSWETVRKIDHPSPLHVLWTTNGNLIIAGRYYIELVDINSALSVGTNRGGKSRFLAFSQAEQYGFSPSGTRIEVASKGKSYVYVPSSDSWEKTAAYRATPSSVANDSYRVYVESLQSQSYRNMVMVRHLRGVDTTMLFKPPEQTYEPFPKNDQPVDFTDFNHGSRIRRREVALVFNAIAGVDGLTRILNVLKEYGIRATFFVNGQFIREHPGAVKELADSGQEVGSLFFTYFNMADSHYKVGPDFIEQGLARNEDEYYRATGKELSLLWHAPYYFLSPAVFQASQKMNYTYVGRDVDSLDWVPKHDDNGLSRLYHPSADLVQRILSEKKPGSIISMTIGKPQDNLAAEGGFVGGRNDYLFEKLDVLLNGLIQQGFTVATVSELMDHAH